MTAKVRRLREQVGRGTYQIDPSLVAEAMLSRAEEGRIGVGRVNRMDHEDQTRIRALDYEGLSGQEIAALTGYSPSTISEALSLHHRPAILSRLVPAYRGEELV